MERKNSNQSTEEEIDQKKSAKPRYVNESNLDWEDSDDDDYSVENDENEINGMENGKLPKEETDSPKRVKPRKEKRSIDSAVTKMKSLAARNPSKKRKVVKEEEMEETTAGADEDQLPEPAPPEPMDDTVMVDVESMDDSEVKSNGLNDSSDSLESAHSMTASFKPPTKTYFKFGIFANGKETDNLPILSPLRCRVDLGDNEGCRGFQLPYDLYWMYAQKKLQHSNPSKFYKNIVKNIYVDAKALGDAAENDCVCDPSENCGDHCWNRAVFVECKPSECPCGDKCTNNRMQKREWIKGLDIFDCGDARGFGVRTTEPVEKDAFVCEYVGEVVTVKTFQERSETWYKCSEHHYALKLDTASVIDAYRLGSIARFINHSCEPNCVIEKWLVNGHYRMGIFALRDIEPQEELSYDYKFHAFDKPQRCLCGAECCRGFVGQERSAVRKGTPKRSQENTSPLHTEQTLTPRYFIKPVSDKERRLVFRRRIFLNRYVNGERRKLAAHLEGLGERLNDQKKNRAIRQYLADRKKSHLRSRRLSLPEDFSPDSIIYRLAEYLNTLLRNRAESDGNKHRTYRNGTQSAKTIDQAESSKAVDADTMDLDKLQLNLKAGYYSTMDQFNNDVNRLFVNMKANLTGDQLSVLENAEESYENQKNCFIDLVKMKNEDVAKSAEKPKEFYWGINVPLIGTYDVNENVASSVFLERADPNGDMVHCICGMHFEDDEMIQCDRCNYWQHKECVDVEDTDSEYVCEFCTSGNLDLVKEVVLSPQPPIIFGFCTYYRSFVVDGLQISIGDTVYVRQAKDEESYKALLKVKDAESAHAVATELHLNTNNRGMYRRWELSVFKVERLMQTPGGYKFVFGYFYARPHETHCFEGWRFHRNEVIETKHYNTFWLNDVVGRCLVLDEKTYRSGRPTFPKYEDEDVYICDYRMRDGHLNKNGRIAKAELSISTEPYIFENFPEPLKLKRDFTPFTENNAVDGGKTNSKSITPRKSTKAAATGALLDDRNFLRRTKKRVNLEKQIEKLMDA